MTDIQSFQDLRHRLADTPYALVYFSSPTCPVCGDDLLVVQRLAERYDYPLFHIRIEHAPDVGGQMMVLTAPTVLIMHGTKEYHRQSRFIDFLALEKRMTELQKGIESLDMNDATF